MVKQSVSMSLYQVEGTGADCCFVQVIDEFWKIGLYIRIVCHILFTYLQIICPILVLLCALILTSSGWAEDDLPETSLWVVATNGCVSSWGFEEDLAGIEDKVMPSIDESTEGYK